MSRRLVAALSLVRAAIDRGEDGAAEYAELARTTEKDWSRLAHYLHGRWVVPPEIGVEDVRQELLIEARDAIAAWDATRGYPLDRYVIWTALDKVRKYLHRERNAEKRSGSAASNFPMPVASFTEDAGEGEFAISLAHDAGQEVILALKELIETNRIIATICEADGDLWAAAILLAARTGDDIEEMYRVCQFEVKYFEVAS